MRRSKLEIYYQVLRTLADNDELKLTDLMFRANVNNRVLSEYLDFMLRQNLVEAKKVGKKRVKYVITQKGIQLIRYFRELKQLVPNHVMGQQIIVNEKKKNGL